jgi:hypothetical protein
LNLSSEEISMRYARVLDLRHGLVAGLEGGARVNGVGNAALETTTSARPRYPLGTWLNLQKSPNLNSPVSRNLKEGLVDLIRPGRASPSTIARILSEPSGRRA